MGSEDLTELLEILRRECETAINWFKTNNMILNPNKFQSMIISSKKDLSNSVLKINDVELTIESSVKLLGIEIDNKPSNQLNAICRLQTFLGHKEKEAITNTLALCLIWHFSSKKSKNKVEKIDERGRALGVDPLHKNDFKFLVYFHLVF